MRGEDKTKRYTSLKCENNKEKNETERGVKLGIKIKRGY